MEYERLRRMELNRQDSIPVINDLARIGYSLEWLDDLYHHQKEKYPTAIPILLKWLPKIDNLDVKEVIIRALSVPWAKPQAGPQLIIEYKKLKFNLESGIRWAIGNALSVVADDSVLPDILEILLDKTNGKSREMFAVALGNMKNPIVEDELINFLDDEQLAGHAIMALRKLKSKKALSALEKFLTHPKTWVRNEAKKAVEKINRSARNMPN